MGDSITGVSSGSGSTGTSRSQDSEKSSADSAAEAARKAAEEAARRAEQARAEAEATRQRDVFQRQNVATRRNLSLDGGTQEQALTPRSNEPAFRVSAYGAKVETQAVSNAIVGSDTQAKVYIEQQFQEKLGRSCDNPDELLAQARASGAKSLEDVQKYVDRVIDGSPEKAALNTINEEFQSKLGRSLTVPEQAQWLRENGLSPTDPNFRQQVASRLVASEEYKASHPNTAAMSPEDAFILQFTDPTYNPTGPSFSSNCGPASLAMAMNYTGHMPPGLTKEQQVDHARALMHPELGADAFTYVKDANGNDVALLDRDHELTGDTMETDGITAAGGTPSYGQGWDELDRALENGPVLGNGYLGPDWRKQFPERVGSGDIAHVNCILGKTPEGKYIVADPMHTGGPVEMTREELAVFFPDSNGEPTFAATGLGRE